MVKKLRSGDSYLIGAISDTHGHVSPRAMKAFKDVDLIIHAGDIGDEKVLAELSKIAPVVAVRGNMDFGKWAGRLPEAEVIEIGQIFLYMIHIVNRLDTDPAEAGFKAVVSGHTHRPDVSEKNGVTFINPGSASHPKFGQPASAALIRIRKDRLDAELIQLKD